MVVFSSCTTLGIESPTENHGNTNPLGFSGVDIFFVLSVDMLFISQQTRKIFTASILAAAGDAYLSWLLARFSSFICSYFSGAASARFEKNNHQCAAFEPRALGQLAAHGMVSDI